MNLNDNRHAYLVMAHHQFELLEMQLKLLDHEMHDFYIHIDKSVKDFDFDYFRKIPKKSKVFFTNRIHVRWGGHSQIRCELLLMEAAQKGNYEYYHLISGVDLPLKSADEIYEFYEDHSGEEFLYYCSDEFSRSRVVTERVSLFYPFKDFYGKSKGLLSVFDRILTKIQRTFSVNRLNQLDYDIKCGANWFSITHGAVNYVLSQKQLIRRFFYYSHCADEIFLATLLHHFYHSNVPLHRKELGSDYRTLARLIDWERGDPYTFCESDLEELLSSDAMFARKFDFIKHPDVCRRLYSTIQEDSHVYSRKRP